MAGLKYNIGSSDTYENIMPKITSLIKFGANAMITGYKLLEKCKKKVRLTMKLFRRIKLNGITYKKCNLQENKLLCNENYSTIRSRA